MGRRAGRSGFPTSVVTVAVSAAVLPVGSVLVRPVLPAVRALQPESATSTFAERLEQGFVLLGEFVPALFGAMVILFAGYLLAKVLE